MHHLKYLRYLVRHKWFVLVAGLRYGATFWRLLIHDWSKFLPSEWVPYAQNFYWTQEQKSAETMDAIGRYGLCEMAPWGHFVGDRFASAWNLHQKRNKHHWQFWLVTQDSGETFPVGMPEKYVREMVADWAGAGRAITGAWEVATWWQKNRGKIRLRTEDAELVDRLLGTSAPA